MQRFICSNCHEPLDVPDSLAGETLVCPKCKKKQVVPTAAVTFRSVKKTKDMGIDPWIYGLVSFLWLVYAIFCLLACRTINQELKEVQVIDYQYERIYYLVSAGFAWLGMILSAILGRLYKI